VALASNTAVPQRYYGPQTVAGSTDHYVEAGAPTTVPLESRTVVTPDSTYALPFNFTFDVSYGINGRNWVTSSGKACYIATVTLTSGQPDFNFIYVVLYHNIGGAPDKQVGPTVDWPIDGQRDVYCFTGLHNGYTYYFFQGFQDLGEGAYVHGAGTIAAS
jgi:hypothetical protein